MAGDVFLLHPLLVHSPTISITGRARAILNIPAPYDRPTKLGQKQGALSAVTLPIQHALARRSWLPLPLLWLLWGLVVLTGHAHRYTRGVRGAGGAVPVPAVRGALAASTRSCTLVALRAPRIAGCFARRGPF